MTTYSPSISFPLKWTLCSKRKLSMTSWDEKLISLDTDLHLRIFFGTLASCSRVGDDLYNVGYYSNNSVNDIIIVQGLTSRPGSARVHFLSQHLWDSSSYCMYVDITICTMCCSPVGAYIFLPVKYIWRICCLWYVAGGVDGQIIYIIFNISLLTVWILVVFYSPDYLVHHSYTSLFELLRPVPPLITTFSHHIQLSRLIIMFGT